MSTARRPILLTIALFLLPFATLVRAQDVVWDANTVELESHQIGARIVDQRNPPYIRLVQQLFPASGRITIGSKDVASSGTTAVSHQTAIQPARPATCHAGTGSAPRGGNAIVIMKSAGPAVSARLRIRPPGITTAEWCL